jgi:hypothetical protein
VEGSAEISAGGGQRAQEPGAAPQPAAPQPAAPQPPGAGPGPDYSDDEDAADAVDLEKMVRMWPAVLDQVRQSGSAMLSALFEGTRPVAVDIEESVLRIGFPSTATFNKRKAEATEQRERFAEALRSIVGERLRPVYVLLDGEAHPPAEDKLDEDELLEKFKAEFDAEEVS